MTVGIDVSKWQATTPPLAGLDFLFARASIGLTTDERYATHIANARKAGLLVGAYHFNWDTLSVFDQVKAFLAAAGDVDFYALDVEGRNAFDLAQTRAFIKGVQAAGKRIGLYMSDSGFLDAGQDWNWVAKWSSTPPRRRWTFWQYQGSPLDKDRFNGTRAQLLALAGIPGAPASDTATEVGMFKPQPGSWYVRRIEPDPGTAMLDQPGGKSIKVSGVGDVWPLIGEDTSPIGHYYVLRGPGDVAMYLPAGHIKGYVDVPVPKTDTAAATAIEARLTGVKKKVAAKVAALTADIAAFNTDVQDD